MPDEKREFIRGPAVQERDAPPISLYALVQHLAGITVEQSRFLSLPIGKGREAVEGKSITCDRGHDIERIVEVAKPIAIGKIKPDIEDATSNTISGLSPWVTAYLKTAVFVRVEILGRSHH